MLNAKTILTDNDLIACLAGLGFSARSASPETRSLLFRDQRPCCEMDFKANPNIDYYALVAAKDQVFTVCFFEDVNYMYHEWGTVEGDATEDELRKMILQASSFDAIKARYPGGLR